MTGILKTEITTSHRKSGERRYDRKLDELDVVTNRIRYCVNGVLLNNADWIKNPASASNFGGVRERQIRSIRNVMNALMKEHGAHMDKETLTTLLCEAKATVNNRPLTVETLSDPLSEPPLSPSTLLTGKTRLVLPPPGEF